MAAASTNYPRPSGPPQSYSQPPQHVASPVPSSHPEKPRPKSRTFSFRSDKSQKSADKSYKSGKQHHPHISLHETPEEKEAKRLHTKADPTLAMNEAEPAAVQATVKSSLAPLRNMQHRDAFGNPIADPDLSNPTRSRWERPLDTIRSFEAAIDGAYNRKSIYRSDSESIANWNRRSSYHSTTGPRFPHDSYYGGRPQPLGRPETNSYDMRQGQFDGNHSNGYANGFNGPYASTPQLNGGRPQRYSKMASESQLNNTYGRADPNVYPLPSNHQSYETVASASGSGSSAEPAGYQTDLTSSDNGSMERMQQPPKQPPPPANDYGIGFSQGGAYQSPSFTIGMNGYGNGVPQQGTNGFANGGPPPVPYKEGKGSLLRKPMSNTPNPQANGQQQQRPTPVEKRKSWFARRFSRQS